MLSGCGFFFNESKSDNELFLVNCYTYYSHQVLVLSHDPNTLTRLFYSHQTLVLSSESIVLSPDPIEEVLEKILQLQVLGNIHSKTKAGVFKYIIL